MKENGYIKNLMCKFAAVAPEAPEAFSTFDGKEFHKVTYPEFAKDILKAAGYFKANGIKGQHIAMLCSGKYEFFVAFFAIVVSGNVAVVLNPELPPFLLKWQCEKADVSLVYGPAKKIREVQEGMQPFAFVNYEELMAYDAMGMNEIVEDTADQTILMMFTSGTTGRSKAVELTSNNLKVGARSAEEMNVIPGMEVQLQAMPRYHIGGFRCAMIVFDRLETLHIGRGMRALFIDIPVINPTSIVVVPMMLEGLVKMMKSAPNAEVRQKFTGTRLKRIVVSGAALRPAVAQYLLDEGYIIDSAYAMTETTCVGTWCLLDEKHIRSVGKPFGGMECCIIDGEICFRGPGVMKGYYKDPEETAKVMTDGWLHSGDIGRIDEDGYYYITGRKKNVIILSNGENVNPEEIEDKLGELSAVLECMVYSDGKGIRAEVYTEDETTAAKQIRSYNDEAPTYHQVYKVDYFAQPLEKTGSGKIKRKENVYEQERNNG